MNSEIYERNNGDGKQMIVRFENDMGVSIVDHSGSYDVELAVLEFNSQNIEDFSLCYDTPVSYTHLTLPTKRIV